MRVVGRPGDLARRYYKHGADEIIYVDAVASLYQRSNIFGVVKEAAEDVFIPLTMGGGVRSLEDVNLALRSGADKVAINSEAIRNPEFLKEGAAVEDFMKPDRVVVGVQNERAAEVMAEIYRPLYLRDFPIVTTDLESAEMIKYAANAFLATKITFINEIAALCERVGGDVKEVARGIGLDGRIGNKFLHAGPGYGGSCFPKDTKALARIGQDHAVPMQITETVIKVNEEIKRRMIDKLLDLCGGSFNGKTIAVLGVTFKPNTDDMRDAPSLTIVPALVGGGAKVRVVDPQGRHEGEALLPGVHWLDDAYKAAKNADLLVMLTEWNEFRALDLKKLAKRMAAPRMADLRNVYAPKDAKRAGFEAYESIGRAPMLKED